MRHAILTQALYRRRDCKDLCWTSPLGSGLRLRFIPSVMTAPQLSQTSSNLITDVIPLARGSGLRFSEPRFPFTPPCSNVDRLPLAILR
jgi:hypothetical protein